MMRNKLKKYLLMAAVYALVLTGCDSAIKPVAEETTIETVEESTEVVEESTETEVEDSAEEIVETDNTEEEIETETVEEEIPVEEAIEEEVLVEEETPVEEVPVEAPVEEVPEETPVEEVPAEAPVEEVPEETPVVEEVIQEAVIPQALSTIKPSDFKLFGYPINENHYQEWKTAIGYTGDDTVGEIITDTTLGTFIKCDGTDIVIGGNRTYSDSSEYIPYIHWSGRGNEYGFSNEFQIQDNPDKRDVIRANFNGPITIGMSSAEVKQLLGFNEAVVIETNNYKTEYILPDGSRMVILLNQGRYNEWISVENISGDYFDICFQDGQVAWIVIMF